MVCGDAAQHQTLGVVTSNERAVTESAQGGQFDLALRGRMRATRMECAAR